MLAVPKSLAIIPARGGSKRLRGKNMQMLNGKPLVAYTVEAAVQSRCFEEIILSSDSEEILAVGRDYGATRPERRPDKLAGDQAKALEVVLDIVDRDEFAGKFEAVALLLPTAPFRQEADIRAGFELLDPDVDSVVSLTAYEFPPQLGVVVEERERLLKPLFEPSPLITGNTRSQDQAPIYRPNGGFYTAWWKAFIRQRNFFKGRVRGYIMPRSASVDIDEEADLRYAQFLLDTGKFTFQRGA
ncbi:MAG TPA: acylneuraminate cytidylyltransferase family protein [Candidatus Binatia bacterium]